MGYEVFSSKDMASRQLFRHGSLGLVSLAALVVALAHCTTSEPAPNLEPDAATAESSSDSAAPGQQPTADADTPDAAPPGSLGRVGDPCAEKAECEAALECVAGTCERATPGDLGRTCTTGAECSFGLCLPLADGRMVCSAPCAAGDACAPGWTCGGDAGPAVCSCTPGTEVCNGLDDDCDGVIDNAAPATLSCAAVGANNECLDSGTCGCRAENVCGGACVADVRSNLRHCGSCDNRCPGVATCTQGSCICPATTPTLCGAQCADVTTSVRHCGACGNACGTGMPCRNGVCDRPLTLTSPILQPGGGLPCSAAGNQCGGSSQYPALSPALTWSGGPPETLSWAVVAYNRNYYPIWGIYDIPVGVRALPTGMPRGKEPPTPAGAKQLNVVGNNQAGAPDSDWGYRGACDFVPGAPTDPTYSFIVYARSVATEPRDMPGTRDPFIATSYLKDHALATARIELVQPRANGACMP